MAIELQIITAREFIRMGAHGQLDWDQSRAVLAKLAKTCMDRHIDRALLDVRDVRSDMTPAELAELVLVFRDVGFTDHQRLAILHRADPESKAHLFVMFAANRGWNVQGFDSFEDAVGWLAIAEETDEGLVEPVDLDDAPHKKPEPPRDGTP